MYKVIGSHTTRGFRVMWLLEELGQDYQIIPAAPHSEEAKRYNTLGKVPALVDGDEVLTDSVAIMHYLADKHGQLSAPAGTAARARQEAMTYWLIDEFDAVLWAAAKHSFIFPEDKRVPEIKPSLKAEYARSTGILADRMQGEFLMGDDMTIPDILAVHCMNWAYSAGFPKVEEGPLAEYATRMRHRDAFKAVKTRAEKAE